jgi:AraC family transcriptional regulator
MLQTVCPPVSTGWPGAIVNGSRPWNQSLPDSNKADRRGPAVNDVAMLYPQAVTASSDALALQNIRVIQLRHSLPDLVVPPSADHCIVLNLGAPIQLSACMARTAFDGTVRPGEVAILPAGASWSSRPQTSHQTNIALLFLKPLFVQTTVAEFDLSTDDLGLVPRIGFASQHIRHIAMSILGELSEASVVGRFYADSLASGLAMQLVRSYSSVRPIQVGHGGMAPHRLRKALGLIDHHVAEEEEGRIALRAIAQEVGMSYFHFSRAFKQSMRMTPTNYIAERRIERAKRLMQETDLPISEIALRSGFSSQSHFTTSFRRLAHVTPRSFRQGI